jgi:serine/threonine protein kinase/formylglycine-generating enzyme required for sulfatase activity
MRGRVGGAELATLRPLENTDDDSWRGERIAGEFGEYRILSRAGGGAIGEVYLAQDTLLDRYVAIKVITPKTTIARSRALVEARAAARLQHPNVASIYRVAEQDGRLFIVSEFVLGHSLDKLPKPIHWRRVLDLGVGVAQGLAAAHRRGVLHRDVKPANTILGSDGEVKLIDFGMAKLLDPEVSPSAASSHEPDQRTTAQEAPLSMAATIARLQPQLTRTGVMMGTPYYLAPELWTGREASPRSEIYALGAMLYELVTGYPPYARPGAGRSEALLELAIRTCSGNARPIAEVVRDIEPRFAAIVDRCLERSPSLRFDSCDTLLEALDEIASSEPTTVAVREAARSAGGESAPVPVASGASRPPAARADPRPRLRWPALVLACSALLLLAFSLRELASARATARVLEDRTAEGLAALERAKSMRDEVDYFSAGAFAAFDRGDAGSGERLWAEALSAIAALDRTYRSAQEAFEVALAIDPGREALPARIAEVLHQRALLAEASSDRAEMREHLEHLRRYDPSGEHDLRWSAPATLMIATSPPGATVTIAAFVDRSKRLELEDERDAGVTPIDGLKLDPGSYAIAISAPGHVDVRYPVLVTRGERRTISIVHPRSADIPGDMVFVPPGRFLFGSSASEQMRTTSDRAAPIHPVEDGGFLIARHETTYGDWIEYLEALAPRERKRRTPGAFQGAQGSVALELSPQKGWRFAFQPSSIRYAAHDDGRIAYRGRSAHALQEWMRLPVSMISFDDGVAYVAWLRASGRVPRARLCTEMEWERAARGADAREYPHGSELAPEDADFDATYGKNPIAMGPDEVGAHPLSASPFGVEDLTGNVSEWVMPWLLGERVAMRGGSYFASAGSARSVRHESVARTFRATTVGLRVCADLPPSLLSSP